MTRTNTIGETISAHDEHEDCPPAVQPCPNIGEPRNCYRVRCQLGKKCVEPKQITNARREEIVRQAIAARDAAIASLPTASKETQQ